MRKYICTVGAGFGAIGLGLGPGSVHAQSVELDLAYATPAHAEQHLDLHWPAGDPEGAVLFVHGGSLSEAGERRDTEGWYAHVCPRMAEAGIVCATTDYRLHPSYSWPTMPEDVARAVAFVRDRLDARGVDPNRLVLFGHSSGCHLVASLGTNPDYLDVAGLTPSDVAGIVPMGCTLDRNHAAVRRLDADGIREAFGRSDDVALYVTAEGWISANPAHHVGPHVPPTLVVLAEGERFRPPILEQGARFVTMLLDADVPAELLVVPGTHRTSIAGFGEAGDPVFAAVRTFVIDPSTPRRAGVAPGPAEAPRPRPAGDDRGPGRRGAGRT